MATPSVTGSVVTYTSNDVINTHSLNSVTVPSGTKAILVGVVTPADGYPADVMWTNTTYTQFTLLADTTNNDGQNLSVWELLNPEATTQTLFISMGGTGRYASAVIVCLTDVDVTSPRGTIAEDAGDYNTSDTLAVTTVADQLVVDFFSKQTTGIDADAGQTALAEGVACPGGVAPNGEMGASTNVATGTTTYMTWSSPSANRQNHIAIPYNGASSLHPQNRGRFNDSGDLSAITAANLLNGELQ